MRLFKIIQPLEACHVRIPTVYFVKNKDIDQLVCIIVQAEQRILYTQAEKV